MESDLEGVLLSFRLARMLRCIRIAQFHQSMSAHNTRGSEIVRRRLLPLETEDFTCWDTFRKE